MLLPLTLSPLLLIYFLYYLILLLQKTKRVSLTSGNSERLVFKKGNMNLTNMELSPEESE